MENIEKFLQNIQSKIYNKNYLYHNNQVHLLGNRYSSVLFSIYLYNIDKDFDSKRIMFKNIYEYLKHIDKMNYPYLYFNKKG